jgi:hypothetical protein
MQPSGERRTENEIVKIKEKTEAGSLKQRLGFQNHFPSGALQISMIIFVFFNLLFQNPRTAVFPLIPSELNFLSLS